MARTTIYVKDVQPEFFPSFDNGKTGGKADGMLSIGYYVGNKPLYYKNSGELVSDILGTCPNCEHCIDKCYAASTIKRFKDACYHRIANTLQLRNDIEKHFQDIEKCIIDNNIRIVRYTESGEVESLEQFEHLVNLAKKLVNVRFYLYTKNYQVLRDFFTTSELPENMIVLISVWGNFGKSEYNEFKTHKNIKCFAVNSDLHCNVFCPAYTLNKNGKAKLNTNITCAHCGLCFNSSADIIGCYEH